MTGRRARRPAVAPRAAIATVFCGIILTSSCGFGLYDDAATPQQTSADDGVTGHGQWWPWACADGSTPSPASAPLSYTASGTCGNGGAFTLEVNGCNVEGNWNVLGLSGVSTNVPSSTPAAGGWEVAGTGSGGGLWTCDARALPSGVLIFTCAVGDPASTACTASLAPGSL